MGTLEHNKYNRHCGHPHRMLLPKGTPEGMKFDVFVMVTDFEKDKAYDHSSQDVQRTLCRTAVLSTRNTQTTNPWDSHSTGALTTMMCLKLITCFSGKSPSSTLMIK